ncbi:MAG: DEAD/DEAH box helicase [Balneolaceae bacterium]|nr:DEAD/DEAH box helicase [Balneolaceae bacterium]MBO6545336.1 DEAD/DEAH box helicase [Balneolaceae bacterium]MBO6646732.1 DEAD/DEAH box helicase [Balneolaceae bacterium]
MSFEEYGLSPELLNGLTDVRIEKPTPLQQEVLPAALQGKHLLVKNEAEDEGTFLIPALQKVVENGEVTGTQVLILTPSIERAAKIDEMIWAMGYHAQISSALLAMKGKKSEQEQAVLDGAPVIVANPGRLIEILEKNNFHLRDLKLMVIDEAHNMENFNLVNRVKDILRFVDGDHQTLILSGSHNKATDQLAKATLKNPELIGFETKNGDFRSNDDTPSDVDLEAAKEKLEKAAVEVVLNPEQNSEEPEEEEINSESIEGEVDLEGAAEKLEEAAVDVVLNPGGKNEETSDTAEEVDIKKAEEKLKKTSITVVLKKDIEEQEKEEVEPVLANPILQGEDLAEPVPKDLEQGYINVPPRMKISTLMARLEQSKAKKVMVFATSKRTTDRLFHIIRKKSWGVVSVSADLNEETYNERFARFTSGEMRICLVGGMAANEVEIEAVEEVINYDVPSEVDEYRYRAELVGSGKASRIISLVSKMDREDIDRISKEVGYPPNELPLPEEVVDKKKKSSSNKKSKSSGNNKRTNRGSDRKSGSNKRNNQRRNNKPPRKKKKEMALPRPTYDGLSGGREGKEESGGVFGWVKKLFD